MVRRIPTNIYKQKAVGITVNSCLVFSCELVLISNRQKGCFACCFCLGGDRFSCLFGLYGVLYNIQKPICKVISAF